MPNDFDAIRAIKEEISGLLDIQASIRKREDRLRNAFTELEVELNSVAQLRGFADYEIARKRKVLQQLEEQEKQS